MDAGRWRGYNAPPPRVASSHRSTPVMTNGTPRDPVRVALVGYGLAGQSFHAPFIASTRGMRLDAIVTRDPERRAQASREHPGARLLDGIDDVLAEADALVIGAPHEAYRTLKAEVPVFDVWNITGNGVLV